MSLISEFNPHRINQLHHEFEGMMENLTSALESLEKATLTFKASINDKTSTEAIQIVNEYKRIIKKMQDTVTESLDAVKNASNKFAYIEDVLASNLKER